MIDTVIFDLDGLLVDTEKTWYHVWNDLLGMYGKSFTLQDYVTNYSGKTVVDNTSILIQKYQLPIDTDTGVNQANAIEQRYVQAGVELMKGAKELLEFLKENKYKIVVGTSSRRERATTILEKAKILDYFDDIVVGYDVKRGKPFPDTFLEAARRVSSEPENCLVLEDSEMGIQAAYAANMKVICIPDLKHPSECYAVKTSAVLPNLIHVIDYLNKVNIA